MKKLIISLSIIIAAGLTISCGGSEENWIIDCQELSIKSTGDNFSTAPNTGVAVETTAGMETPTVDISSDISSPVIDSIGSSSVFGDSPVVGSSWEGSSGEIIIFNALEGSNVFCWLQVPVIENTREESLRNLAKNCDIFSAHLGMQYQQPEILKKMKELNPQIKLLSYVNPGEMFYEGHGSYGQQPDRTLLLGIDEGWWIKGVQNSQPTNRIEYWPGMWMLNMSIVCPVAGGRKYNQYFADMVVSIVDWKLWDGLFLDGIFKDVSWIMIQKRQGITCLDYDSDGNCQKELVSLDPEDKYNNQVDEWLRQGTSQLLDRMAYNLKSLGITGKLMIGNGANHYYYDLGLLAGVCYEAILDDFLDNAIDSYRKITRGDGWNMISSIVDMDNLKISAEEQRKLRFNTSFARLGNAFYAIDNSKRGHGEQYFDDVLKYKFGRLLLAFQFDPETGLYSSEYERARVFWNNTGKAVTVIFDQPHYLIQTDQMSEVYSGGQIMEVTIPPQDGRIVFKKPPEKREEA